MLFQHPWDVKADGEDDEAQALSPDKNQIIDDKTRFENLSSKLQRSFHEKNMMLGEIQSLKSQLRNANSTNNAIDAEREAWNRLIDANVRSGIMACVWCMKAQVVKMTAMAFHKWKVFKILDIRMNAKQNEKISYDSSNTDAMVEAAAAAAQYFRHLMAQISPEELSDNEYSTGQRLIGTQEGQYNGTNGRKNLSSPSGPSDDMKWIKNNPDGIHPGSTYSPVDSPECGLGEASEYGRGPGGGSPVRDRELDSWARNDRSRGRNNDRSRERGRGNSRERVRESSRENRNDSRSDGNASRRSESAQRNVIRSDPSPQYMISTASFASKLKKLRVDSGEVKRKPGMRAGSVSTALKYSTNQRSQSFSSSFNPNKFKSGGTKSDSAQRDYAEYGEDVMEFSGPMSGSNIENFRVSRDNDFSTLRHGGSSLAHTQHTQRIMRSKSTDTSRGSKGDRSRTRVVQPAVERENAQLSSSMARSRNGYSSSSVKEPRESIGYVNIYLKEHSLRVDPDTVTRNRDRDRDRYGSTYSSSSNVNGHDNNNGKQQAFFSPTLLRRTVDPAGTVRGAERGTGCTPNHSPGGSSSPLWLDESGYREGGSPGGVYTMPQFKRYHEQLGRARGRS